MSSISLTEEELRQLSGRRQPAAQLRYIRRIGIPAERRPDGTVLVLRCDYERGLKKPASSQQVCAARARPVWPSMRSLVEMTAAAAPFNFDDTPQIPAVYFLFLGDAIQYVGQSTCLCSRLLRHAKDKPWWNRCSWVEIPHDYMLRRMESQYIVSFRPPRNRRER